MNLFKQLGVFFILTLLMVKTMIVPALFINYELRKDFIIQNYCENINRPELECDGKCYLAKQIKAAQQEDERQSTDTFLDKVYNMENFENSSDLEFCFELLSFELDSEQFPRIPFLISNPLAFAVFHPPQA